MGFVVWQGWSRGADEMRPWRIKRGESELRQLLDPARRAALHRKPFIGSGTVLASSCR